METLYIILGAVISVTIIGLVVSLVGVFKMTKKITNLEENTNELHRRIDAVMNEIHRRIDIIVRDVETDIESKSRDIHELNKSASVMKLVDMQHLKCCSP